MFIEFEKYYDEIGILTRYVPYHSIKFITEIDQNTCYIELQDGECLEADCSAETIVNNLEERMSPVKIFDQ